MLFHIYAYIFKNMDNSKRHVNRRNNTREYTIQRQKQVSTKPAL